MLAPVRFVPVGLHRLNNAKTVQGGEMKAFAAFVLGCLLAVPVFAGGRAPPSRLTVATELLQVMHGKEVFAATSAAMVDAMIHGHPMLGPYRGVLLQWAQRYLSWKEMRPKMARLYARAFTARELEDLIRFYGTPTGQKAIRELPMLARRGALIGEQMARQHLPQLRQMIKARAAQLEKKSP